nr:hypothetical protein [Advenella kashmirensis]
MKIETESAMACSDTGLVWPSMVLSSTAKAIPAHWLISIGHARRTILRTGPCPPVRMGRNDMVDYLGGS